MIKIENQNKKRLQKSHDLKKSKQIGNRSYFQKVMNKSFSKFDELSNGIKISVWSDKKISTFSSPEVDGSKNAGVTKFFACLKIEFFKKVFL